MEKFFVEKGNYSWTGSWISQYYLKNDEKLNKKTSFFLTESKEQH